MVLDLRHSYLRDNPLKDSSLVDSEALAYPREQDKEKLLSMLSELWDIKKANLLLGNGASQLIDAISYISGRESTIITPTFFQYQYFTEKYNYVSHKIDLFSNREPDVQFSSIPMRGTLIWLCNPNNPTGHWINREDIVKVAEVYKGIVAVDETFSVFKDPSLKPLAADDNIPQNIVSVRSFSKEWGIPGARLGCCIADPEYIKKLSRCIEPYSVNSLALKYGILALSDIQAFTNAQSNATLIRKELARCIGSLGYSLFPTNGNFIAVWFGSVREAKRVVDGLERRGVFCASFTDWEFTSKGEPHIRIAIPSSCDYQQVVSAFQEMK